MTINRTVTVNRNNQWEHIEFEQLKCGDVFRLYEPDGTQVGDYDYVAESDPYYGEGQVLGIHCHSKEDHV